MDGQDLGSAIDRLVDLVKGASKTEVLEVKGEPQGVYYLVGPDGQAQKVMTGPGWHKEALANPQEMRAFIEHLDEEKRGDGVVFIDDARIVFVFDLHDRRDRAICELVKTSQFRDLELCGSKAFNQAEFVRFLRINLRDCLPADSNLLQLVRQLRWTNDGSAEGSFQHGKESIGRSITNAVTGQSSIPEEVTLSVQVFENHPFKTRVTCAVEILPHEQAFRLVPFPMQLRQAVDETIENVRLALEGDDLPLVSLGKPLARTNGD